jgi:hypothetical protein
LAATNRSNHRVSPTYSHAETRRRGEKNYWFSSPRLRVSA